jgi:DNA polymerase III subunit gamma/tau
VENFIVSARKYRPITFDTVVGQGSITSTLKNAIRTKHLAQSYLFCGPRGVGKTTCARIFAKTLNCLNLSDTMEACNHCESCQAFNENRSYNIHELDAASNNSVDDIRNLIDQVRIPPQIGKYSIYIIDEVHMLSASAFNAFLKTLEEPPKHAIFILATTEKHKIIPTILSRCQIFDFSRIKINDTVQYLAGIAKSENIEYEEDAFTIIAQKADGAMRDALSIFDQVVSFSGNKITYKSVIENLNVLDYEYYFRLTDSILENNVAQCLLIYDEIIEDGFDGHNFVSGLSSHLRDLLVCKDAVTLQLLEVGTNIAQRYKDQAARCTADFLFKSLNITNNCDLNFRNSKNPRLHVELALIQLANITLLQEHEALKKNDFPDPKQAVDKKQSAVVTASDKVTQLAEEVKVPPFSIPKISVPSIKDALKGKAIPKSEPEKDVVAEVLPEYPEKEMINNFSQEALEKVWNAFSSSIKEDQPRLATTLTSAIPLLKEEFIIEFSVSNSLQQDAIKNYKHVLLPFLHKELKNSKITLDVTVSQQESKSMLYSDEDKYRHMVQKNPALGRLKQQFNLDF